MESRLVSKLTWDPWELYWKVSFQDEIKQVPWELYWKVSFQDQIKQVPLVLCEDYVPLAANVF